MINFEPCPCEGCDYWKDNACVCRQFCPDCENLERNTLRNAIAHKEEQTMPKNLSDLIYDAVYERLKDYNLSEYIEEYTKEVVDDLDLDSILCEKLEQRLPKNTALHNLINETAGYCVGDWLDENLED